MNLTVYSTMRGDDVRCDAVLSEDGRYRYRLGRRWDDGDALLWVMLNPSTADHIGDDNTIRRCVRFARGWGYAAIEVVNLFALRTTFPRVLRDMATQGFDVVGPENDAIIRDRAKAVDGAVVVAWGATPWAAERARAVYDILGTAGRRPLALRTTKDGQPAHPLRLPAASTLTEWTPR